MTDLCPVCGGNDSRNVCKDAPYRRCRNCKTVFNTAHATLSYSDDYFTADYKAQYGRTYEDDFDAIYRSAKFRLQRILRLQKKYGSAKHVSVLDIGCALGFFLKAAEDAGFTDLHGIEISAFAAGYAEKRFGYEIQQSSFDKAAIAAPYDLISAWYFLEHLPETGNAVARIYDALKPGGIAAFSLPSAFGPLYCCRREEWVQTHPVDHRVDFTPSGIRRTLKQAGFRHVSVYPSGIHPERILSKRSLFYAPFAKVYGVFSHLTAFSDTIEVYAVR